MALAALVSQHNFSQFWYRILGDRAPLTDFTSLDAFKCYFV